MWHLLERLSDDRLVLGALHFSLRGEHQAVGQHWDREGLDVVGQDVGASAHQRPCARSLEKGQRGTR